MGSLPKSPGVYAVQFTLSRLRRLQVGSLGQVALAAGEYIYLGSARGPGGLRARLGRHLRPATPIPHWHIDHLRQVAQASAYCYLATEPGAASPKPLECLWSQALAGLADASLPIPGFGCSDCRSGCRAHLVFFQAGSRREPLLATHRLRNVLSAAANASIADLVCQTL